MFIFIYLQRANLNSKLKSKQAEIVKKILRFKFCLVIKEISLPKGSVNTHLHQVRHLSMRLIYQRDAYMQLLFYG